MTLQIPVPLLFEVPDYALFEDVFGRPRLSLARYELLPLTQSSIPFLIDVFKHWQSYDEYMLLEDLEEGDFFAVKCSKRGNDVYERRLQTQLGFLDSHNGDHEYFSTDFKGSLSKPVSPIVLWVTFTYDSKLCSLNEAWTRIMPEFNDMITRLRAKYFSIQYVMFPQPFPNPSGEAYGYPHIHCVMIVEGATFNVFPHMEEVNGELRMVYRIRERDEFRSVAGWHSWVDIKALRTADHIYNYVTNYARHSMVGSTPKVDVNNAILWLYRKKGFNMSGFFKAKYSDLIRRMRDYGAPAGPLEGDGPLPRYKFHGVFGLSEIREFKEIKDPPGWVILLDREAVEAIVDTRDSALWDLFWRDQFDYDYRAKIF